LPGSREQISLRRSDAVAEGVVTLPWDGFVGLVQPPPHDPIQPEVDAFGRLLVSTITETLHHILSVMAQHSGAKMRKLGNSND
jgi:hypothetical protein